MIAVSGPTELEGYEEGVFSLSVSGGLYDTLQDVWELLEGSGTFRDHASRDTTFFKPRNISTETAVFRLRVTANVAGADHNAKAGTTASASHEFEVTITKFRPDASFQSASVDGPGIMEAGESADFNASVRDGFGKYDRLNHYWKVSAGSISGDGARATFTAPDVDEDTEVTVSCRVLATGEGDSAKDGTSYSQTPAPVVLVHGNE